MSKVSAQIPLPIAQIEKWSQQYPVKKLALFGSVLRDDFTETSDVDILVEYIADAQITLLDMATHEMELTDLIGRKVDLRTANELSPHFRQSVIETARVVYERTG